LRIRKSGSAIRKMGVTRMPYMIYQQYKTAVKEAYAGDPSVAEQAAKARECREWLASLKIESGVRNQLVEQLEAIEEAFHDLLPG